MDKNKVLALLVLTWFLASCANNWVEVTEEVSNIPTNTTEITTSGSEDTTVTTADSEAIKTAELTINNKCIGCGHCVKFAVNNFKMSWHKAIVTSQENIDSTDVSNAIDRCPVGAISIG